MRKSLLSQIVFFLTTAISQQVFADDDLLIPAFPLEEARGQFNFSLDLIYGPSRSDTLSDLTSQTSGEGNELFFVGVGVVGVLRLAEEGYPDAQIMHGFLKLTGIGGEKNLILASVWFEMAKATTEAPLNGQSQLKDLFDKAASAEVRIKKLMTPNELEKIKNISARCRNSYFRDCSE